MISIEIDKYTEKLTNQVLKKCANLMNEHPIDLYLNDIKSFGKSRSYNYLRYIFEELPLAQTEQDYKNLMPQFVDKKDLSASLP